MTLYFKDKLDGYYEFADDAPKEWYAHLTPCEKQNPAIIPLTYAQLRAAEYPSMADYLDAVVKGDLAAQKAYIDACLAVKLKYPKN